MANYKLFIKLTLITLLFTSAVVDCSYSEELRVPLDNNARIQNTLPINVDNGLITPNIHFIVWLTNCIWDERRDLSEKINIYTVLLDKKDIRIYTIEGLETTYGLAGFYTIGNIDKGGKITICIDKKQENNEEFLQHLAGELANLYSYLERYTLIHGFSAINKWLNNTENNGEIKTIISDYQSNIRPRNQPFDNLAEGFLQIEEIPIGEGPIRSTTIARDLAYRRLDSQKSL